MVEDCYVCHSWCHAGMIGWCIWHPCLNQGPCLTKYNMLAVIDNVGTEGSHYLEKGFIKFKMT